MAALNHWQKEPAKAASISKSSWQNLTTATVVVAMTVAGTIVAVVVTTVAVTGIKLLALATPI
jgi:hypothetical protein